jgi:hypothetical protein
MIHTTEQNIMFINEILIGHKSSQELLFIVHRLNMPHDDDPKCIRYRDSSRVHNVMSRMLDHKAYPWAWSNCSRHVLTEFLE